MYFIAYVDRSNIGFAALTMNRDLGLTPDVFGFAAGIFYLGYILFEVPSNVMLHRFGARLWLARIMITWGLLSIAMAFAQGATSLSILRFLLGFAEAGLAPGLIFYLTVWFPKQELAKVISYYYLGLPLSTIVAGPLSGWILDHFGYALGIRGWQWLFILEGIPAVIFAFVTLCFLTNSPEEATWLTSREKEIYTKVMHQQRSTIEAKESVSLKQALLDFRVWTLGIAYCFTVIGITGLGFWMPQIIKQFDFTNTSVGLLTMIPYGVGTVFMYLWSAHSDQTQERLWHFILPSVGLSVGFAISATASSSTVSLLGMTVSTMGFLSAVPVFYTFPASFLTSSASAVGLALINSIGNIGGFLGPYLIGVLTRSTGGTVYGLWAVAALVLIAPIMVAALSRSKRAVDGK